jgi:hypothetical protein
MPAAESDYDRLFKVEFEPGDVAPAPAVQAPEPGPGPLDAARAVALIQKHVY